LRPCLGIAALRKAELFLYCAGERVSEEEGLWLLGEGELAFKDSTQAPVVN
jgi:hypothetical protein